MLLFNQEMSSWNAEKLPGECIGNCDSQRAENSVREPVPQIERNEHSEKDCMKHGICSHDVLHDGESDSSPNMANKNMMKKVYLSQVSFFLVQRAFFYKMNTQEACGLPTPCIPI